jgi:hypothetical protein
VITSAAVLVEVIHPKINDAALNWTLSRGTLSRLTVEPVTKSIAHSAAALLRTADLHGHKHAIDAMPWRRSEPRPSTTRQELGTGSP